MSIRRALVSLLVPVSLPVSALGAASVSLSASVGVSIAVQALWAPAARADDVVPLTAEAVSSKGICDAVAASTPVKEYYTTTCKAQEDGQLNGNSLRCTPKAELADYYAKCPDGVLRCNFTAEVALGKAPSGWEEMFERLLLQHDRDVVKSVIHLPDFNQYWAGACLNKENYRFMDAIEGLALLAGPEKAGALRGLLDTKERRDELGQDLRLRVARALWAMGAKALTPEIMGLLELEHIKRYPGRDFREVLLMALAHWGSDAAESLCADNMAEISNDGDLGACLLYLAKRGRKDTVKTMIRQAERGREPALHALGLLGGPDALKYLGGLREKNGEGPAYIARDVALANAGDKKAWKSIEANLARSARPDRSALNAMGFLSGGAAKQGAGLLARFAKAWKKENEAMYALSVAIRAQLGDKAALKELPELLESPEADVREQVAKAIGGDFGNVWSGMPGFGLVADASLLPALAEALKAESSKSARELLSQAIFAIRGGLRAAQ